MKTRNNIGPTIPTDAKQVLCYFCALAKQYRDSIERYLIIHVTMIIPVSLNPIIVACMTYAPSLALTAVYIYILFMIIYFVHSSSQVILLMNLKHKY